MQNLRIIKVGGNVINKDENLERFLNDFAGFSGLQILVHGGGRTATELAKKLNINTQMIEGRRVTNAEMLDLCKMVYGGLINKSIVAKLQSLNCNAIGMSGADANMIPAELKPKEPINYGFIGLPSEDKVPVDTLVSLLNAGLTPVFCALTHDGNGQLLNTNADTIASSLAIAASKKFNVELVYCFEKNGVLMDAENDDSVIPQIDSALYEKLLQDKVIFEGMIPKMDNCFNALKKGVNSVVIKNADYLNDTESGSKMHL